MSSVAVQVKGLSAVTAMLSNRAKDVQKKVQEHLDTWAINTHAGAVRRVPVDEGHLKNAIKPNIKPLNVSVVVAADYAAYVEFGTKKFAAEYVGTLPPDWQAFAAQFKGGSGGSFQELVKRLTEWVHRKGLGSGFAGDIGVTGTYSIKSRKRTGSKKTRESEDKQAAYAIAIYILKNGSKAHPFLYPASEESRIELERNIKASFG